MPGMALLGGLVFFLQSLLYAFAQTSEVDEGAYLYQGYLFVRGIYHPFQAGGPWMYNAPLSYLIWGGVQAVFGAGIRTGRFFAVFLGVLMLFAVWIVARRLAGKWWAVACLWAVALDPALIKLYSMAESQVLIACMLAWVLALAVGEKRPLWMVTASSILAGLILLTRHNLVPVLPILLVYIFWQHGRKAGVWASSAGLLTVLVGHAIFWPGILVIWTPWLPAKLTPFLAAFRPPQEGSTVFSPAALKEQLLALTAGFRYQFPALAGSLAVLCLWPAKNQWKSTFKHHTAVFLAVLFFCLLILHGWASVFNTFCVFCFTPYLSYFDILGVLLAASVLSEGIRPGSIGRQVISGVFLLFLFLSLGYSTLNLTGPWLLNMQIPRLKTFFLSGKLFPGFAVWDVLGTKLGLDYLSARRVASVLAAFILFCLFLLVSWAVWRLWFKKRGPAWISFSLIVILILGTALSPIRLMAGGPRDYDCPANNILAYERTGAYLASIIPSGSTVYWAGGSSILPLVYVPGIQILPGQIYDFWSFSPDPDTQRVLKFGMWNEAAALQWRQQADFILIQDARYDADWDQFFRSTADYVEQNPAPGANPCDNKSAIRIFARKP